MASSSRAASQPILRQVHLHCAQCHTHIGSFDNQWARVSGSYARPVRPGTHLGTETARKIQVVPQAAAHRALQGCVLAAVFCKKCSAVVGQYCKTGATHEQARLVGQYFYKLSRTYLKDSQSDLQVDLVFSAAAGGSAKEISLRESGHRTSLNTPAPSSHTPQPSTGPSAPSEPFADTQSPDLDDSLLFRDTSLSVVPGAVPPKVTQDARMALESRQRGSVTRESSQRPLEQRLQPIWSVLESFQTTLQDVQDSLREIRAERAAQRADSRMHVLDPRDLVAHLESMVKTLRQAPSSSQEVAELRAENAELKAKLDAIVSAVGITQPDPATIVNVDVNGSSARGAGKRVLGKRKRAVSRVDLPPAISALGAEPPMDAPTIEEPPAPVQLLSPRSRTVSDSHSPTQSTGPSQPASNHAPTSHSAATTPLALPEGPPAALPARRVAPKRASKQANRATQVQEVQDVTGAQGAHEPEKPRTRGRAKAAAKVSAQATATEPSNPGRPSSPRLPDAEAGPVTVPPNDTPTGTELGEQAQGVLGENVEFSDDELLMGDDPSPPAAHTPPPAVSTCTSVQPAPVESAVAGGLGTRTLSRIAALTVAPNLAVDVRSEAPEPVAVPRLVPRRLPFDAWHNSNPEMMRQGNSKSAYKPAATKLLEMELRELGLEEWLDKPKRTPEYRKAVEDARSRQREMAKRQKLASRGILDSNDSLEEASTLVETVADPIDQALHCATQALLCPTQALLCLSSDVAIANKAPFHNLPASTAPDTPVLPLDETITAPEDSHLDESEALDATEATVQDTPAPPSVPHTEPNTEPPSKPHRVLTRKQRREEIRRRDQLAKEAMDMAI